MQASRVMRRLREGKPVLCTKTNFNEPAIIELMGLIGFDCVWICREHLWANDESLAGMILAARSTGMDTMVRIGKEGPSSAIRPLEMGAKGLMVPHILSAAEAARWVRATRFHPLGLRGIDAANADADWALAGLQDYISFANRETFVVAQIEDVEALDHLEDIAKTPGVDVLFVGPADLSQSMGCPGETTRDEIVEVLRRVAAACKKYGKYAGAPSTSLERTERLLDMGYLFIAQGADLLFLRDSFINLRHEYEHIGFSFEHGVGVRSDGVHRGPLTKVRAQA